MFWISVVFILVQNISFRSILLLEIDLEMIVIVKYIRSISEKYWNIKQTYNIYASRQWKRPRIMYNEKSFTSMTCDVVSLRH